MLTLWVHDVFTDKRLHAITLWGSMLVFGAMMGGFLFAQTQFGRSVVAAINLGSA